MNNRFRFHFSSLIHQALLVAVFVFLSILRSSAEEPKLYRWQDSSGRVHYSSVPSPDHPSEVVTSPPVQKENIDEKNADLQRSIPESCSKRGGVDCSLGADKDGSVICADGWAGAELPYRLACTEAVLRITRTPSADGEESPELDLMIRNLSGVRARRVTVVIEGGKGESRVLTGPTVLEPYGVGRYSLKKIDSALKQSTVRRALPVRATCENCGMGAMLTVPNELQLR